MSLYRTYRPQTFADVAGQSAIVDTLNQAVAQDKLAHAYLFAGVRGTGKTSIARILAKELLTQGITDLVLKEQILRAVEDGSLVDLTEIDAASNRGIDDIRSLLEKIQFTPVVATAKVYIIDEVHMLTREAFNALLKTLEEPPAYAYFILATTELHKIPATIQSRCQRFLFRQIKEDDLVARLRFIADKESITIEQGALKAIAHHAMGSMRDAISLLDQLRSLSKEITVQDVKERIGESGHEYVEVLLQAIASADRTTIIDSIRSMEEAAVPLENVTRLLLEHTRNTLHAAIQEKKDTSTLLHLLDVLMETIRDLRATPVPGLVLESALLSLIAGTGVGAERPHPLPLSVPPPTSPERGALQTDAVPSTEPLSKPNELTSQRANELTNPDPRSPVSDTPVTLETLKREWPSIIDAITSPSVRMSLKNGQVHALEGHQVIVGFGSVFHRDKVASPEGGRSVDEALEKIFHQPLRIKCVLESDLQPTSASAPSADAINLADAIGDVF